MRVVDKRGVVCSLALLAFIAFSFWTQSRLPALDEKAQMGQRNSISSLAFDVVYPLSADQTHFERIFNSSINWAYTNWQGMSFGFLLAAAVLTLFSYLSIQFIGNSSGSRFKQAAIGSVLGTPLGVCANCSTPIAFGFYRSGLPVPTALAMLSSSPSFNIIVVTMSLSLLPLELVLIKSTFVLIFVLLVIPILSSLFPLRTDYESVNESFCNTRQELAWGHFFKEFFAKYSSNLLFILKGTLPFMLLAGLLAATISEFVSLEMLSGEWTVFLLFCVALCAAFFPVPIAFDVVISVALLAAGLDIVYVATIFFALGVFSIYPAMMIAKDLSVRLSLSLLVSVVALAMLSGITVGVYSEHNHQNRADVLTKGLEEASEVQALPDYLSRPLIRKAAKTCHALGEPAQYACFERFVSQLLKDQFSQASCVYLEDAVAYRQICDRIFNYHQLLAQVQRKNNVELCQPLSEKELLRCRYDFYFDQSVSQQSLLPCLSLVENDSRQRCLSGALALNIELYSGSNICSTLDQLTVDPRYFAQCLQGERKIRHDLSLLQQGDLELCDKSGDKGDVLSCQIMLINNKLERGAEVSICETVEAPQLQSACHDIYLYFQASKRGNIEVCEGVKQSGLRSRCVNDAKHADLSQTLATIQFDYLSKVAHGPVEGREAVQETQKSRGNEIKGKPLVLVDELEIKSSEGKRFSLKAFSLEAQSKAASSKNFMKLGGTDIGLQAVPEIKAIELFEPFSYGRGIAAGDMNKDLWPDIAIAYGDRVRVYRNQSGGFHLDTELVFGTALSPMLVSLVDLDGDAYLDLFVTFYSAENRIYWNEGGNFDAERYQVLHLEDSQLTMSAAFLDVDQDGDLDMALGSWFAGDLRHFNPYRSQNYYVENKRVDERQNKQYIRRKFKTLPLPGVQGETLSLMLSDIDNNGIPELIVGNDMDAPDIIYRWNGKRFDIAKSDESLPQISSFNTMSIASGDLNRDSKIDYFSTDMSFSDKEGQDYCLQNGIQDKDLCIEKLNLDSAIKSGKVAYCEKLGSMSERRDCYEAQVIQLARQSGLSDYCAAIEANKVAENLCIAASRRIPPKAEFNFSDYPQGVQRNVLSLSVNDEWKESANGWGISQSHWSWHSKIADLDNDGWKDIYVGNGYMFGGSGRRVQSNSFFLNEEGQGMRSAEVEFGLEDYLNTPSFVTIDFDRDGDLDIITQRVAADHGVFINQSLNPGMSIELLDQGKEALGARLTMKGQFRGGSLSLTSEQVLGGGFLSFDKPEVHFGMKGVSHFDELEITWPSGKRERINYPFKANHYYQLNQY